MSEKHLGPYKRRAKGRIRKTVTVRGHHRSLPQTVKTVTVRIPLKVKLLEVIDRRAKRLRISRAKFLARIIQDHACEECPFCGDYSVFYPSGFCLNCERVVCTFEKGKGKVPIEKNIGENQK